ncbi:MAG TPA: ribbon-helix-helix domain-containing protein [Roseiarcus sp.]|jgi:predicted DNA-binding ribbon-helix-helix protein|nr:ribbon-helix-helix domain-containing protein [Roseiarcus sp.]
MTSKGSARVVKRSLVVAGHHTSVSLEEAFWRRLKGIAAELGLSVNALAARVDSARGEANLSSALRVFVLELVLRDPTLLKDEGRSEGRAGATGGAQ